MNTNKFMIDVIAKFPNSATATHKSERDKVSKFAAGLTDQQRLALFDHLSQLEKDHEVNAAICRQWFMDEKAAARSLSATSQNKWGEDPNAWKGRTLYADDPDALADWNWSKGFLRGQDLWEEFVKAEREVKVYVSRLFDVLRYDHGTLRPQMLLDAAGVGTPEERFERLFWHAREMPRCQTQSRDGWKVNGGEGFVRRRRQDRGACAFTPEEIAERRERYSAVCFDNAGRFKDNSAIIHSDEWHALTHEWNVLHPHDPHPTEHLPGYRGR